MRTSAQQLQLVEADTKVVSKVLMEIVVLELHNKVVHLVVELVVMGCNANKQVLVLTIAMDIQAEHRGLQVVEEEAVAGNQVGHTEPWLVEGEVVADKLIEHKEVGEVEGVEVVAVEVVEVEEEAEGKTGHNLPLCQIHNLVELARNQLGNKELG